MPANPMPTTVTQSDGSSLTIRLVGDEFRHFTMTTDGYAVVRGADGDYKYAELSNGNLVAGDIIAHEASKRSATEISYLQQIGKVRPTVDTGVQKAMRSDRNDPKYGLIGPSRVYDYHNFKGLVLLVQYSDRSFSMSDPLGRFTDMVTSQNYTGFGDGFNRQEYTGSVRDYFYDNSTGMFDPEFDVYGPFTVTKSQYFVEGTSNIRDLINEALQVANPTVDFSQYDTDGDGYVDMFYVIFAGAGSNVSGNDSRLVWPHAWTMSGEEFDGVRVGRYACSTELYGYPSWNMQDGIGTICHEFSHVLGLMDEYDTDYDGSGGLSNHPSDWSLMASGGYLNMSRTPTGYTLMQRQQSGFCVPVEITEGGIYTLDDIDVINNGYRISTSDPREYFLLENKRKTSKWNKYNAGSGMLIHRVDSTNTSVWDRNTINANPSHNYYYLLRAVLKTNAYGVVDHDGDPFPGSYNVTAIDYDTDPALIAWSGKGANLVLKDIEESDEGIVSFYAYPKRLIENMEDFEDMETTGKYDRDVEGKFTTWNFLSGLVEAPESGWSDGKAVGLFKNGSVETGVVEGKTNAVSLTVFNPSSRPVTFNVRYSIGGNNWDYLYEPGGLAGIAARTNETATYRFDIPQEYRENVRLQVRMANNTGSTTEKVYFDNFSFIQDPGESDPSGIETPVAFEPGNVANFFVEGNTLVVLTREGETVRVFDSAGRLLVTTVATGNETIIPISEHGLYLLRVADRTAKILL